MTSAQPQELDEFCASCGAWVSYLHFNYSTGWCESCTPVSLDPRCSNCGNVLTDLTRTTCQSCRLEQWLERWADELEYLIVAKGYSVRRARETINELSRPICQWCRKPIVGGRSTALFHGREHTRCNAAYRMFVRLRNKGIPLTDALTQATLDSRRRSEYTSNATGLTTGR